MLQENNGKPAVHFRASYWHLTHPEFETVVDCSLDMAHGFLAFNSFVQTLSRESP